MKNFSFIGIILIFTFVLVGCWEDASDSSPRKISSNDIYVSQKKGKDILGYGTSKFPYKTISYALSKITSGSTIFTEAGEYTEDSGEKFPLILPRNIGLVKYGEDNESVTIEGFGSTDNGKEVLLILNGDNRINGVKFSSLDNIDILSKSGKNTLNNITLSNNENGLGILNDSKVTLIDSSIENNSYIGVELSNSSRLELVNSKISKSNIGIYISDDATIENSVNSKIIENSQCDFFTNGSQNLKLQGLSWDSDVFDFNIKTDCSNGNNIVNIGEGTISYQPIPNNLLFSNIEKEILILSPKFSETIHTTEPTIKYTNTQNSRHIMVTIWTKLPKVNEGKIVNSKDIIWYWHTGMNNSPVGRIKYEDGAIPIDGDLNTPIEKLTSPKPLEHGRSYYLAVWEWDDNGIEVISSSSISYFIVAP